MRLIRSYFISCSNKQQILYSYHILILTLRAILTSHRTIILLNSLQHAAANPISINGLQNADLTNLEDTYWQLLHVIGSMGFSIALELETASQLTLDLSCYHCLRSVFLATPKYRVLKMTQWWTKYGYSYFLKEQL